MKRTRKSVTTLLFVLLVSWLFRFFAMSQVVIEIGKKLCSVTWNS